MPRRRLGRAAVSSTTYGRGTGIPHPIDVEVGARIRERRLFLGMNQEALATQLGLTFQQIQKYEGGANRVSASRLATIAEILGVVVAYFFDPREIPEMMRQPETIDLVRYYYRIPDAAVRRQFLDLVKAVASASRSHP